MNRFWRSRMAIFAIVVGAVLCGALRASADDITRKIVGRFVCTIDGEQVPLPGVHPVLFIDRADFGLDLTTLPTGHVTGTAFTGSDGSFSFDHVPSGDSYRVEVGLSDADGVSVRAYGSALPFRAQTYRFGAPGDSDVGTNQFPGPTCAVFQAVQHAEANYREIMGSRPPYGDLHVEYGGPTEGFPWSDGSSIEWPSGYAAGDETALDVAAAHEMAHTIENFAFQGSSVLQEALRWDLRVRRAPCATSTPEVAFYEGFAAFWAGDYAPAPGCPGVSESDASVEGMVAWRLTKMEHLCTTAGRKQMVANLLKNGRSIHSIDDFAHALGPCNAGFLDPARVQRYRWAAHVDAGRFVKDIRDQVREAQRGADRIASKLDAARSAARHAVCPPFPCGKAVAAKLAPSILTGAIAQEKLLATTLAAQVSPSAQKQLTGPPTQSFLRNVVSTPTQLAQRLGAIGSASIGAGLRAAAPLVQRDHKARTADSWVTVGWAWANLLKSFYRHLEAGDSRFGLYWPAVGAGGVLPVTGVTANLPDQRTRRVPWSGRIHASSGEGSVLDTLFGVRFGGPHGLGFPGNAGPQVCEGPPIEIGGSDEFHAAKAPACPAADRPGDYVTGTMVRFPSPVQAVSVGIGAKRIDPSGHLFPIAAILTAYDATGKAVALETTTVAGNSNGNPEKTLKVSVGKNQGITYLELSLNAYTSAAYVPPNLTFNELAWIGA